MDWLKVVIYTTTQGIEPVTGRLYRLGATGVEIEDESEFNGFLEQNRQYWDYVNDALKESWKGETKVCVYIDGSSGEQAVARIRESMLELRLFDEAHLFGRLELSVAKVSEEDWANNWKQYFKPIEVGEKILIKPEWEPLPEGAQGRTVFTVDPGMAFGTGAHETTRLCIEALERHVAEGASLLDLGCGSGILSVIGLLLGAGSAVAVDIDPVAVDAARRNAALNGIGPGRLTVLCGNVLASPSLRAEVGRQKYGVVVANIVADVIIALAPLVPSLLAQGGVFICSGVIDTRKDEVVRALRENGLGPRAVYEENGWVAMEC